MIYIIQFSGKLGSVKHQAQYYIGSCADDRLDERLQEHRTGQGAAITRAAVERGFTLSLACTLPGSWKEERQLKARKNTRKIVKQIQRGVLPKFI